MMKLTMRSKLFVPGVRPELFRKALASAADVISLDLEDSVPEALKEHARANVAAFFASGLARQASQLIVVRINSLGTVHFDADLSALVRPGLSMINLPKPETAQDVLCMIAALERAEERHGVTNPIQLLLNVETPKAMRNAVQMAGAHARVVGLQLGLGDMFEPHRVARRDMANVHAAMFAMRMAAAEAGVFAMDGAFADIHDAPGFADEALMAARLGYTGKSCIHPSQIACANEVFGPRNDEIEKSKQLVEAADLAAKEGRGAFTVDGRMIDQPFLECARATLAAAGLRDRLEQ